MLKDAGDAVSFLMLRRPSACTKRGVAFSVTMRDPDPWGSIINPLWAAHSSDAEEAWDHAAKSRAASPQPEEPPVNVLARPQTEESSEDVVIISPQTEALLETVLAALVSRDEGFSGPERDQLATPWTHAEGPDRRRTCLVEPLPDRVSPHLELFLAQLAVPVRCTMRAGLGRCGGLHFCVMHLSCCTVNTPFLPSLPVLFVPLSVHRATTLSFSRPFVAPHQ